MRSLTVNRRDRIARTVAPKADRRDPVVVFELRGALARLMLRLTAAAERIRRPFGALSGRGERSVGRRGTRRSDARRRRRALRSRALRRASVALVAVTVISGSGALLWSGGHLQRAAAGIEAGALALTARAGFSVQRVTLVGRRLAPRGDLLAALEVGRGDPIVAVDLVRAHARIEALGWVEQATLTRRLPDGIHIVMRERVPLARWQRGGETVLVDAAGTEITGRGLDRWRQLPLVVGAGANLRAAETLALLAREPRLYRRVRSATLVRERRWDVGLAGGVVVRLPEQEPAAAWHRLAKLDGKTRLLERDLAAIDLRFADRLVVRLSPGAAEARRRPGKSA